MAFPLKEEMQTSLVLNHKVSLDQYFIVSHQSTNLDASLHGGRLIVSPCKTSSKPSFIGKNTGVCAFLQHCCVPCEL